MEAEKRVEKVRVVKKDKGMGGGGIRCEEGQR